MNDQWEQYRAKSNGDDWSQYHSSNFENRPNIRKSQRENKITIEDNSLLKKAGDISQHIINAVEGTGLPSLSKGFFETGTNIGRGLANLIPGVNIPKQQYKELNVNPYLGTAAETIGSFGAGLPVYKGYQAAKKGIEMIPHATKIPEILRNVLAGSTVGSAISPEHRGLGAALGGAAETIPFAMQGAKNYIQGRNTIGKEKDLYKAMMEHEMQKAQHESLKNLSKHEFGINNPESLMLNARDKASQLAEAEAFKRRHFGDEQMLPGQQLIPEAEHRIKTANEQIKHNLGEGDQHSKELSEHIVNAIEGVPTVQPHPKTGLPQNVRVGGAREAWGHKMDELEHSLPEVKIPSTDTKAVDEALKKFYGKKSEITDEEKEAFKKLIEPSYTKEKNISGRQFFRAYRSLRSIESKERSKAFGLDPKAHDEWIDRANDTKKTYEQMEEIIKKHFPEGTLKRLYELNHEYSTKIGPLHENPIYQQMLKHGQYKGDLIHALSGTTKGNDILNNAIQNNQELSRLVLGHSFAKNPEKLMEPNKEIKPFLKLNPQIKELMRHQKEGKLALESAKKNAEFRKEIDIIPQLTKDIREQTLMANRLKNASEVKGITKSEVAKKKIEYEKAQQKLRALKNKLIGASLLTTAVGYTAKKVRE